MSTLDKIMKLTRQLYPTGRAWKLPFQGFFEQLHAGLAVSEADAHDDAVSTLDSILPDNPRFTEQDATDWERRLGMITNEATPLEDRKLAIQRKMAAPGTNPAKAHYLYIEQQLQAAGFTVYVHENLIPLYPSGFDSVGPYTLYGSSNLEYVEYDDQQYNGASYGQKYNNLIVQKLDKEQDNAFDSGATLRTSFFIGGQTLGTYANVDATREEEFRKLIISLKQPQTVGYLFINFV